MPTPYWFANSLLNAILKGTELVVPTPLELAFSKTIQYRSDSTVQSEVSGGSYARKPVTFAVPFKDTGMNSVGVVLPTPTADWGWVETLCLCARSSGGGGGFNPGSYTPQGASQVLWFSPTCGKFVKSGGPPPSFGLGDIKVSLARGSLNDDIIACAMSYAMADLTLGLYLNGVIGANPTAPQLALSNSEIGPENTSFTEVTGTGYARQAITFGNAAEGISRNSVTVTFPPPTSDWTECKAVVVVDGSGSIEFSTPVCAFTVKNGDPALTFPVGNICCYLG
jgi:hypothetical protein